MAVSVELFPVTGQTLPLISSGGTSIWMTCLAIGIILSVSAKRQEIKEQEENLDNPLEKLLRSRKRNLKKYWVRRRNPNGLRSFRALQKTF